MEKIIIITHNFLPESLGGASRIYEMSKLLKQDYEVNIICPPPTYPFTKYKKAKYFFHKEILEGLKIFRIWTYQPSKQTPTLFQRFLYYVTFPMLAGFFLITLLHKAKFVMISTPPTSLLILTIVLRLLNKKIIIDVRDLWIDAAVSLGYAKEKSVMTILVKRFERYCWQKAELIIANSIFTQDVISQTVSEKNKSKIKYFPFNVDLEIFKKNPNIKTDNHIIYIGNFGVAQNLQAFINAIPIIIKKIPDLRIQLYGGGDSEKQIKSLVKELKLDQYVEFNEPVPRDEIPTILSKSTLGLIPLADNHALRYAMPTKTFEYFACSLPVIAFGSSDELERTINESKAGIHVRGNDQNTIADTIIKLLNNKTELEKYAVNARLFVERQTDHSFFLEF
jgi:glycosyltransferase involved in cell wall biosynthesis